MRRTSSLLLLELAHRRPPWFFLFLTLTICPFSFPSSHVRFVVQLLTWPPTICTAAAVVGGGPACAFEDVRSFFSSSFLPSFFYLVPQTVSGGRSGIFFFRPWAHPALHRPPFSYPGLWRGGIHPSWPPAHEPYFTLDDKLTFPLFPAALFLRRLKIGPPVSSGHWVFPSSTVFDTLTFPPVLFFLAPP